MCYILLEVASDDHGFNRTTHTFMKESQVMDNLVPSTYPPGRKSV